MNRFPKRVWVSPESRAYTYEKPNFHNAKEYLSITEHNFIQKTEKEKIKILLSFLKHVSEFPIYERDGVVATGFKIRAQEVVKELGLLDENGD